MIKNDLLTKSPRNQNDSNNIRFDLKWLRAEQLCSARNACRAAQHAMRAELIVHSGSLGLRAIWNSCRCTA